MLYVESLAWKDFVDEDDFLSHYRNAFPEFNQKTQHAQPQLTVKQVQPQLTVKQVVVTDNVLDFDQFEFGGTLLSQNNHLHAN